MSQAPRVTVAICTWNRAPLLRETLEAMARLVVPRDLVWELLVVNNNCTDNTDEVIAGFTPRLPLRRVFEPEPGLSNARNRAAQDARGAHILWTDDDVLVDPNWLAAYRVAFERRPDASVFGGPITPWFPNRPPRWLTESWPKVAHVFAALDLGIEEIPLSTQQVPFGANFATRTELVRAARFDPALGVRPGSRMGGEETDLVRRLLERGTGWWVPGAIVQHWVPMERQRLRYLHRWNAAYGKYLAEHTESAPGAVLFGRPRWLWREVASSWTAFAVHRVFSSPHVWVEDFSRGSIAWGRLRSAGGGSRGAPPQAGADSR